MTMTQPTTPLSNYDLLRQAIAQQRRKQLHKYDEGRQRLIEAMCKQLEGEF